MPIQPLPQFESDAILDNRAAFAGEIDKLHPDDKEAYERLKPPRSVVVRFGSMKLVGEYPYQGDAKPGCGSKLVVRTHRGTEIGEMLTSTCPNSGCSKSVSRKEMLQYVENSGGRDYPFFTDGRVLRIATKEDLDAQSRIEQSRNEIKLEARAIAERLGVKARVIDAEPILGGETLTFFVLSEERLDLRDLYRDLGQRFQSRIDIKLVGARDEARLTADYEKCGQYCCCKNFLKVLKPVSMKSAKVQKATLDPLKISGRCGRLMCCLRYEDQTYEELKARLPRKKSRVGTPEGDGLVLDSQILTQLVLVELDDIGTDGKPRQVAVAVEDLTEPVNAKGPVRPPPMSDRPPPRQDRPRGPRPDGPRPEGAPEPRPEGRRDGPRPDQRSPEQRGPEQRSTDSRRQEPRGDDRPQRQDRPPRESGDRPPPSSGQQQGAPNQPHGQPHGQPQGQPPQSGQRRDGGKPGIFRKHKKRGPGGGDTPPRPPA